MSPWTAAIRRGEEAGPPLVISNTRVRLATLIQSRAAAFGPDGFGYFKSRAKMDLSVAYEFSRRLSFIGSMNNVFNQSTGLMPHGSPTPFHYRQNRTGDFGAGISIGINGSY